MYDLHIFALCPLAQASKVTLIMRKEVVHKFEFAARTLCLKPYQCHTRQRLNIPEMTGLSDSVLIRYYKKKTQVQALLLFIVFH